MTPPPAPSATSILAVDLGNVMTRALLIDLVEGVYHLVAQAAVPTTGGFPNNDVGVGLARVLHELSAVTGRRLFTSEGRVLTPEQPDRSGVDLFFATTSMGRPLRTVLLGLVPGLSVESGIRAAAGTYINIVDTIALDDVRSEEEQLNALVLARPDLIFITGGTEGGAYAPVLELAQIARLAIKLMPRGHQPLVLYAGNSAAAPAISAMFEGLTNVFTAANVRPTLETEALESAQLQLALAFDSFTGARGLGFESIGAQSRMGVLPNAQSYHLIVDYLGRTEGSRRRSGPVTGGVLAVDVGSAVSTLSASIEGNTYTTIRTDIGLGHSAPALLDHAGIQAFRRWLPFAASDEEIRAYAMNKMLRPATIPNSLRARYLEHALLRTALATLLRASRPVWTPTEALDDLTEPMPPFCRIIGAGGGLTGTGRPGMAAMLLLDALEPIGVAQLQLDATALLPALGALAWSLPEAVVQLLDASGLETLGMAFSLSGRARAGRTAARVRLTLADGTVETATIAGGSLWMYPLAPGAKATISIACARGLSIGGKRRLRMEIEGGLTGVVIDARGRPLPLGTTVHERARQLPHWYAQATGDPPHEINSEWLREVEVVDPRESAEYAVIRGRAAGDAFSEMMPSLEALGSEQDDRGRRPSRRERRRARREERERRAAETAAVPAGIESAGVKDEESDDLRNLLS
ncbi:MAG: glutamate mutase L [Aggregatilineales bacterium]